jgi:hypothetical protein
MQFRARSSAFGWSLSGNCAGGCPLNYFSQQGASGPFVVLGINQLKQLTIHLAAIAPLEFYHGEQPRLPALELLCSRGRTQPFNSRGDSAIFEAIGVRGCSFALQRLCGEVTQPENIEDGFWCCADPVSLRADRDQVFLTHPASIQIQHDEADALIAAFNQLFDDDGMELWRSTNTNHWYLRSEQPWQLITTPLDGAEMRTIRELLPQGEDAQRWRKVLTEVEMLFYTHPVNQQRVERGAPLISSLWLFGEQQEKRTRLAGRDMLLGAHALLKGANQRLGVTLLDSSTSFDELLAASFKNGLMVSDELLTLQRTAAHHEIPLLLQQLEQQWFVPALQALKAGRLKRITIQPANGAIYRIKRRHLLRFWRSSKPVWHEV